MRVSSAHAAVAANIAPTAKQITEPGFILFGARADAKDTHWFRIGVRLPLYKVVVDVSAKFIAKHVSAVFPKRLTTRRSHEVYDNMLPTHPQRRREQSLAPLQKRILRI